MPSEAYRMAVAIPLAIRSCEPRFDCWTFLLYAAQVLLSLAKHGSHRCIHVGVCLFLLLRPDILLRQCRCDSSAQIPALIICSTARLNFFSLWFLRPVVHGGAPRTLACWDGPGWLDMWPRYLSYNLSAPSAWHGLDVACHVCDTEVLRPRAYPSAPFRISARACFCVCVVQGLSRPNP